MIGILVIFLLALGYFSIVACGTLLLHYTIEMDKKTLRPVVYWFVVGAASLLLFSIISTILL